MRQRPARLFAKPGLFQKKPVVRRNAPTLESLEDRLCPATLFMVTTLSDTLDPAKLSLRQAVNEANNTTGDNTIELTLPGTYAIGLPVEPGSPTGEFLIKLGVANSLAIVNTSGGTVVVDAGYQSRVFEIMATPSGNQQLSAKFQGFSIQNGQGVLGGAIEAEGTCTLNLEDLEIRNSIATDSGGGIYLSGASLYVKQSTLINNQATKAGGGIGNAGASEVHITNSILSSNSAGMNGGGIAELNGTTVLDIDSSLISGNSAATGGGIFEAGRTVQLANSTISGNEASGDGAALELELSDATSPLSSVINCTITNNTAQGNGGGLNVPAQSKGSVVLIYVTINANSAKSGAGIYYAGPNTSILRIQNSIIAQNLPAMSLDVDNAAMSQPSLDNGNNVIGIGDFKTFNKQLSLVGTAQSPVNAVLNGLAPNGGPMVGVPDKAVTLPTESLGTGSPAQGFGSSSLTNLDERGSHRPVSDPDSGAYQSLSANQALVASLFTTFLHRPGNLANPNDAGAWVNVLDSGMMTSQGVANGIARSSEALAFPVAGLFPVLLGRAAEPAAASYFVSFLQRGGTLEQVAIAIMISPEYINKQANATGLIQSFYVHLLGRSGSDAEVNQWVNLIPIIGVPAIIANFESSTEFRTLEIQQLYGFQSAPAATFASRLPNLLHRAAAPTNDEISGWVNSKLDALSLEVAFASSPEYARLAKEFTIGTLA